MFKYYVHRLVPRFDSYERNTNRLDCHIQDCVNAASSVHYPRKLDAWNRDYLRDYHQPEPATSFILLPSQSIYSRSGLFLTKLQGSSADLRSQGSCGPPVPIPIIEFEGRPRRPQKVAESCLLIIRSKSILPKPPEAHSKRSSRTRFLR